MDASCSGSTGGTLVGSKSKRKRCTKCRIPIKRIQKESARQVCFSKRRRGLFNKAHELAVLCGTRLAVIILSPAGVPYSFIHHPSNTPSLLSRYIPSPQVLGHALQPDSLSDLTRQVSELNIVLAADKKKEETLQEEIDGLKESIWGADVENLSLDELEVVKTGLVQFISDMTARADRPMISSSDGEQMIMHDASGSSVPDIGTSSNAELTGTGSVERVSPASVDPSTNIVFYHFI